MLDRAVAHAERVNRLRRRDARKLLGFFVFLLLLLCLGEIRERAKEGDRDIASDHYIYRKG